MPADGSSLSAAPSSARVLASGRGWRISDVRCERGPQDRRFEESHTGVSLAAVLTGTFQYRSGLGRAMLYPGAVLLGQAGTCFECGHDHSTGDRCLAFRFEPDYFDEIAAGISGGAGFRMRAPMLPALRSLSAPLLWVQARLRRSESSGLEEAALQFAESVLHALADASPAAPAVSARDQRRISAVVRHVETHSGEALDLEHLAGLACMSKYHFLRTFRRTLGLTPHQFLIHHRLRCAAQALRDRENTIAAVALDAGFGDVSAFNALFRQVFGMSPKEFRLTD